MSVYDGNTDNGTNWDDPNWAPDPPPFITPGSQPNPTVGPNKGVTDPSARSGNAPDPNSPEELARLNTIYGPGGTAMRRPSSSSTWDAEQEQWNTPAGDGNFDDDAILAQIGKWAQMPGADPSLAKDPNYWLGAIKGKGGLNPSNLQYWQDASVGPTAFFNNPNRESGSGGAKAGLTGGPNTGFADPAYQQLVDLARQRINSLGQPQSFPQLDQYMAMLARDREVAQQRAQAFADQLYGRVSELQKPLLTDANVVQQRALASNNLLASRDTALKNVAERRSAAGFAPTSGLQAGDERAINESYGNQQSGIDAKLQQGNIATDESRRNLATQLQGLATQALRGGDISGLQDMASMADLENQMFNLNQNREREQLTTARIPVDLTNEGFANANAAANGGGDPLSSILSLISLSNGQQGLQQNNSNSNASSLAWLMQFLR